MKKMFLLTVFICACILSNGQIIKSVTQKIKNRVETKVNNAVDAKANEKIDQVVDTTLNKAEKLLTDITTAGPDTTKTINSITPPSWKNKFLKEGQWNTDEIAFDATTASFKPESMGPIKEIATLMNENPGLKMKIIALGETGGDQAEFESCYSLASMIKLTLTNQFGIDQGRMVAEGKLEGQKNVTSPAKAANRKVRLIKL